MTTAYLGIKAVANTAKSIGLSGAALPRHTDPGPATTPARRTL
ncbi:hypothetical protein ACFYZB_36525 [Streptomyces sp. NPDC001852]